MSFAPPPNQHRQAAARPPLPPPPQQHPFQPQHHRLASAGAASVAESGQEGAPSIRWRGSLLDAYLGGQARVGSADSEDALAYQRTLLGGEGAEAVRI